MNRNNQAKIAQLYFKQGIISLIFLALSIYLCSVSSIIGNLFPPLVEDLSHLSSSSFIKKNPIVQIHCDTLYYTGYDNYTKEEVSGHYYYTVQDNYCMFVLLEKTNDTPEDMLKNFRGTVKITENETAFTNLTVNLSKDMEWSARSLQKISLPLIASEPDYHFLPTIFLLFGFVIFS